MTTCPREIAEQKSFGAQRDDSAAHGPVMMAGDDVEHLFFLLFRLPSSLTNNVQSSTTKSLLAKQYLAMSPTMTWAISIQKFILRFLFNYKRTDFPPIYQPININI